MRKNKIILLLISILFFVVFTAYSQIWQETTSRPEGGGVTELITRANGDIFVSTGSLNWPAVAGGIRRSTNDGATWDNVYDAYSGRTIMEAGDGHLYASIWPYPSAEGVYRSEDNGDSWDLLTTVPTGNNIFAIGVNPDSAGVSIFLGTRVGILRSLDNGVTWSYSNNGLPTDAWVRNIDIDEDGIIAIATLSGTFLSYDNGATWDGLDFGRSVKVRFVAADDKGNRRLYTGMENGEVYVSEWDSPSQQYMGWVLAIFFTGETSGIFGTSSTSKDANMLGITTYPSNGDGGGFNYSSDDGDTWTANNSGLSGSNPNVSALTGRRTSAGQRLISDFYLGLYDNSSVGAKVYKITYEVVGIIGENSYFPTVNTLYQNYPNPFNPSTKISYSLVKSNFVKLKIYESNGREIETLINEFQPKGNYSVDYNSKNLNSGVYYYSLFINDKKELTNKMILIK